MDFLRSVFRAGNGNSGNPRAGFVIQEAGHPAAFAKGYIAECSYTSADLPLKQVAAQEQALQVRRKSGQTPSANVDDCVAARIARYRSSFDELFLDAGKQINNCPDTADEQNVPMGGLRRARPALWALRKTVAVKNRDMVKGVGKHPGCKQTSYASANNGRA